MISLDKLRMKGFKSFYKQTVLEINPGITIVVGPNGSGKSNIMDALSFVLGSLSFSGLRAKRASEMIYAGKNKKSEHAMVEAIFNDPDQNVSETGELRIGRKLLKDGTSIYRINNKRTTRLAVIDLLNSINIFPDNHSIIKQGDISKFVKMSPNERRLLVESLAGIELYEKKKIKAAGDLAEVRKRLEKVDAIHGERLRVFESLKQDKLQVEQFNTLKSLETRARFTLLQKRITKLESDIAQKIGQKESSNKQAAELDLTADKKKQELIRIGDELESKGFQQQVELAKKLEETKFGHKALLDEQTRLKIEIENTQKRRSSLKAQLDNLGQRKSGMKQEKQEKQLELTELKTEMGTKKQERGKIIAGAARLREEYEQKKKQYDSARQESEELRIFLKEKQLESEMLERRLDELSQEQARLKEQLLVFEAEKQKMVDKKKQAEKDQIKLRTELKSNQKQLTELRDKQESLMSSFSVPRGVQLIEEAGLGQMLARQLPINLLEQVLAYAYGIVVKRAELGKAEKLLKDRSAWALLIPDDLNGPDRPDHKLGGIIAHLSSAKPAILYAGTIDPIEFEQGETKKQELVTLKDKLTRLEKRREGLTRQEQEASSVLENSRFDVSKVVAAQERISAIKQETKSIRQELGVSIELIRQTKKKLVGIRLIEPAIQGLEQVDKLGDTIAKLEKDKADMEARIKVIEETLNGLVLPETKRIERLLVQLDRDEVRAGQEITRLEKRAEKLESDSGTIQTKKAKLDHKLGGLMKKKGEVEERIEKLRAESAELRANALVLQERISNTKQDFEIEKSKLPEFQGIKPIENPTSVIKKVSSELRQLGALNFRARDEFNQVQSLVKDIEKRLSKLKEEEEAIFEMIEKLDMQKKSAFMEIFTELRTHFKSIFKQMLGGEANLELEEPTNPFDGGVLIQARPYDKLVTIEALSGGEKTLTALAFIFAIQHFKPSPFYIFDEVDAALDKENSQKLAKMFKEYSKQAQIISVTHNDTMVGESDQIIGVYMKNGTSSLISLPKDRVMQEAESWLAKPKE
ncbi:MAG: AAA family ATPase [Candidatus Altiarchaeota archaeon]|nr:AAA family ATPase [Candidatus Altiarchaeota archaeon]